MLKVKHLTFLSQKIEKKAGIFIKVAKKIDFLCNLVSRFILIFTKICFVSNASDFRALALIINRVMTVFSPNL